MTEKATQGIGPKAKNQLVVAILALSYLREPLCRVKTGKCPACVPCSTPEPTEAVEGFEKGPNHPESTPELPADFGTVNEARMAELVKRMASVLQAFTPADLIAELRTRPGVTVEQEMTVETVTGLGGVGHINVELPDWQYLITLTKEEKLHHAEVG